LYRSADELEAFFKRRCLACAKCGTSGLVEFNCSDQMAYLFLHLTQSASGLDKLSEIKQTISFRNSNPDNPIVRFQLEFVNLHKEYKRPIRGVTGHAMGIVRHEDNYYFYDSMGYKKGQMIKMAGLTAPLPITNCAVEFVCYSRI
jgi:hypothetical protein